MPGVGWIVTTVMPESVPVMPALIVSVTVID
jgi:hypothetical protein